MRDGWRENESRRFRGFDHISGALRGVLDGSGLRTGIANYGLFSRWPAVVGEHLAASTRPLRVQGKTLWVFVENAVLQHHLSMLTPRILEKIHKEAPGSTIDSVRFTLNPER